MAAKMRATESAIAAQHDHQPRIVRRHVCPFDRRGGIGVGGAFAIEERVIIVLAQPIDQFGQQLGELRLARLTDNRDRDHALSV